MHTWFSAIKRLFGAKAPPGDSFNFVIEIGPPPGRGRTYPVSVLSSPAGRGQGTFRNPFGGKGKWLGLSTRHIGESLFSEIFRKDVVRDLYLRSLGAAQATKRGLNIRLSFDVSDSRRREEVMRIAALPWELLYDSRQDHFLNLHHPVVRHLELSGPVTDQTLPSRGRILLAWANPAGTPLLDLQAECERVARICSRSKLSTEILENATTAELQKRLKEADFAILHFMGHGDLDQAGKEGVLLFEDGEGGADPIQGESLAPLLRGLRLVVLNACHSGTVPLSEPLAGVATALVTSRIPAVLAMQSEIHDGAAMTFSEGFYKSLAAGSPVEKATLDGRLAVLSLSSFREEWQVPVLYQSLPDLQIGSVTKVDWKPILRAAAVLMALLLTGALLWPWPSEPPPIDESPSVDIACPDSGLVQTVDQVRGLGRDPTRSYYLFIQDQNSTCWLQEPIPLPLDANGKWSTRVPFSGPPGAPFTIFAVSSRQPLHPERFSQPGRYNCSVMLRETEREACLVEVAPATD